MCIERTKTRTALIKVIFHTALRSIREHVRNCQKPRNCQVRVYSSRGSSQVWTKTDEERGQRAGQEISPAGVGDRLDSTTKDDEH